MVDDALTYIPRADAYNRKMDVINRGFSGYNTDWIIPVFEQVWDV